MEKTKNYYLISDSLDWKDEFDVFFFIIMDEDTYKRYMYLKKVLGSYNGEFYFGTNEGWDGDFDYLQFNPKPISINNLEVFNKYGIAGENFFNKMWDTLDEDFLEEGCIPPGDSLSEVDFDLFKAYVDEFAKEI